MKRLTKNRATRLRVVKFYLLIIILCAFLLLCISLLSLYDQRLKLKQLSSSNLQLMGEQLAAELEKEVNALAGNCLSQQNLKRITSIPGRDDSLEALRAFRKSLEAFKGMHPIADHFFLFTGSQLTFPPMSAPAGEAVNILVSEAESPQANVFYKLVRQGEARENTVEQQVVAAEAYRRAEALAVPPRLKAFALSRQAAALHKANSQDAAVEAYQRLATLYGDEYDEFQVPYILSLATAPGELERRIFPSSPQSLHGIYLDLINGKWELSAEQTARYLAALEERMSLTAVHNRVSPFLGHFHLARALIREQNAGRLPRRSEASPHSFEYDGRSYQIFCVSVPRKNGSDLLVGFSISTQWIEDTLIPAIANDSGFQHTWKAVLAEASAQKTEAPPDNVISVPFRMVLRPWVLKLPAENMQLHLKAVSREVWFIGLSAVMFVFILGLSTFLFFRVSWEARWFQLRSDFVSGVSHEFKTPLSLIRLYSETLAGDGPGFSNEDRINYIRIIARESERLSRMIDNVLDFSKIEKGHARRQLAEGDLTSAVSEAISDYSEYLAWRGFSIKSSFWPELPPVRFSREQVTQMILNLLDNARKYSGQSRLIRVNVWVEGGEVIIEVQDKGLGIPPEEIGKIFQPFYRLQRGDEKGGCGLGLYLVDQVMKEHAGRVEVESTVGEGSRFRLIFPVSAAQQIRTKEEARDGFSKA